MRKLSALLGAAVLALAGAANAQTCFQFDNFCDAIQISPTQWSSWDCAGTDAPMTVTQLQPGLLLFACTDAQCPFGEDWIFPTAVPNQVFWLYNLTSGTLFQSQQPFSIIPGACTNAPGRGTGSAL